MTILLFKMINNSHAVSDNRTIAEFNGWHTAPASCSGQDVVFVVLADGRDFPVVDTVFNEITAHPAGIQGKG